MFYRKKIILGGLGLALLVLGSVTLVACCTAIGVAIALSVENALRSVAIGNSISLLLLAIACYEIAQQQESHRTRAPVTASREAQSATPATPTGRSADRSQTEIRDLRERQLQAIFSGALDAIAIADDRGDYVEANPAACQLFGLSLDRLLGKRIADFMETEFDFDSAWRAFIESGQQTGELSLLRADGTHRVVEYAAKANIVPGRHLSVLRDVTEPYQVRQALRESQHFLQQIADTIPNHLYVYDLVANRNIYTNRQMQKFLGCTHAEIEAKGSQLLSEILHPDDLGKLPQFRERFTTAESGDILTNEWRLRGDRGQWRTFRTWEILFSKTPEGLPEKILGTAIDISDRREAELARKKSEQLYRTIARNFPNGAAILFDRDLRYTLAEGEGLAAIGLSKALLEGKTIWEVFSPAECEILEPAYRAVFAGEASAFEMPYRQKMYWVQVVPVKTEGGEISAGMVISQDITDRYYAQRALLEERNFVTAVLDTAGALVVVLDAKGQIVRFNRACERTTGYSFHEVKGGYIWDLFLIPEEVESVKEVVGELQSGKFPSEHENYWVGRDGKRHAIAWSNTVLFDAAGSVKYIIATGIDITHRKCAEEIRLALEREQELSQLQIRFFSRVAHEFRTPLSTILMSAQILQNCHTESGNDKQIRNLVRIQTSVKQMLHLLDDIMMINRAETGQLEFNPKAVDLQNLCADLLEEMQGYGGRDRTLEFWGEKQPESARVAVIDGNLLRTLLGKLLSNAIEYSSAGTTVGLSLSWAGESAIFQVSDRGMGIVPEDRPHLFEPFYRGQNVGTIPGSGLGLTVAKKCVDLHGGAIAVDSTLGFGSCFTVTLPRAARS